MFALQLTVFFERSRTQKKRIKSSRGRWLQYLCSKHFFIFMQGVFTQKLNVRLMSWTISNTKNISLKKIDHILKMLLFRKPGWETQVRANSRDHSRGECSALESIPRWGVTLTPVEPVLVPGCSVHSDKHTAKTCARAEPLVRNEFSY